ncbi:MAG: class B sortase [Ruminococcus sp.]|nr:class B sortase [Ruminococcus sp.]
MKKLIISLTILLLLCTGAYSLYRYRQESVLPQKRLSEALEAREKLFSELRPDMEKASEAAAEKGSTPDGKKDEAPLNSACKEMCPDTVGWIYVPDTRLDHPIVQCGDNTFYLDHGLDGSENVVGVPFLDYRCSGDFSGYNSIVYSHNTVGMKMFAEVESYKDRAFMEAHPGGLLITDSGAEEIRFFAYMTVPEVSPVYHTVFITDRERLEYAELLLNSASYSLVTTPEELTDKRLILLSTCTFEYEGARGVLAGYIG